MAPKAARRQGPFWLLRLAHQSEQPARRLRGRHRRGTLLLRGHTCAKKQGPPKFGQNGAEQTSQAPQDPRTPGAAPKCGQPRPTRRLGRAGTQAIPRPYPGHTPAIPRPYRTCFRHSALRVRTSPGHAAPTHTPGAAAACTRVRALSAAFESAYAGEAPYAGASPKALHGGRAAASSRSSVPARWETVPIWPARIDAGQTAE